MSYNDENPKRKANPYNELFRQSYPEYHNDKQERGGCLSIFLILQFVYSAGILFYAFSMMANRVPYRFGSNFDVASFGLVLAAIAGVRLLFLFATWKWIKWGYLGILIIYALAIVAAIFSRSILTTILVLIESIIFFALIKGKMDYFE